MRVILLKLNNRLGILLFERNALQIILIYVKIISTQAIATRSKPTIFKPLSFERIRLVSENLGQYPS